jgi:hypothetical protein
MPLSEAAPRLHLIFNIVAGQPLVYPEVLKILPMEPAKGFSRFLY